jgi:hypothetical protein
MTDMTEYQAGESVRLSNVYIDDAGDAFDPATIEINIYDPLGALQQTVSLAGGEITKDSDGHYHYDYLIPAAGAIGAWNCQWTAGSGLNVVIDPSAFMVAEVDDKLYCTVEQAVARAGMDETSSGSTRAEVRNFIRGAMGEINTMHQRSYDHAVSATAWFNTGQPDRNNVVDTIFLDERPIQTVVSLAEYDTSNALIKTYAAAEYWVDLETGRIQLATGKFTHQTHRIKVVYTHGYEQVPSEVNALCAVMGGLSILDSAIGGSTSDVTNYTVGGMSVGIGETYAVMRVAREKLEQTYKRMVQNIGNRRGDVFI